MSTSTWTRTRLHRWVGPGEEELKGQRRRETVAVWPRRMLLATGHDLGAVLPCQQVPVTRLQQADATHQCFRYRFMLH